LWRVGAARVPAGADRVAVVPELGVVIVLDDDLYAAVTARLADRYGQALVLRPQLIVFPAANYELAACATGRPSICETSILMLP
jgi:hypothetical protein